MAESKHRDRYLTIEADTVDAVLNRIDHNEQIGSREMRGSIAGLSRIAGRLPEEDARSTAIAIKLLSDAGLPLKNGYGDDALTNGERAAVISLSLYSIADRQSYKPNGESFGSSMGKAIKADSKSSLSDLMRKISFDDDLASVTYDLSRAVRRLGDVGVDYAVLVNDLIHFQDDDRRQSVLNRWVKDYYRTTTHKTEDSKEAETENRQE